MEEPRRSWERVVSLPPGPELAAALADLPLSSVPPARVVDVLLAQSRQLAHEQARMLAALVEVASIVPGSGAAEGELAAALTWTARAAERELGFAEVVVHHLPLVFAALRSGRIDRPKAWVFADHLDPAICGLTAAQIARVCADLVPRAPLLTTAQLAARLLRAIVSIDPEHARRRYAEALRRRQVIAYLDREGTVTVSASGLPAPEAAAVMRRLDLLAAAVKRAGFPGSLAAIQADLFCGLLDGRFHRLTEAEIITEMVGGADPAGPANAAVPVTVPEPRAGRRLDPAAGERVGVEIRVGLSTLLGLDDLPGEIPELGPVVADVARDLVAAQARGAAWRFAVTDSDGYLLLAGALRRRPKGVRGGRCSGGVVEIHVPADLLGRLSGEPGPWAGVIGEIADRFRRRGEVLASLDAEPTKRRPGAALARHIQVRDRTCSYPGCRRPARRSDLDHTHDHARGGRTTRGNLGPACERHHLYKHELGWRVRQRKPGRFEWISPLGRIYRTRGEPISPPMSRRRRRERKRRPPPNRPPPRPPSSPPGDDPVR